jgi:signal transduction histidine kinase
VAKPLRALIVEDSEQDAELLLHELRRGDLDVTFERVDTADAMSAALERQTWDVILSDYSMPTFDARSALSLMHGKGFDLPFIIVSGTVGEETAVEAMRAGVHDYFVKAKLGPRLIAAIEREVREGAIRAERTTMQEQLLVSDRMVSMGTLAAGVAHEINNPLASVMANLDLAARDVTERVDRLGLSAEFSEVREELHDARESAERIRNIVRDLKIFSRSGEDKTGVVDVQRVMESTLRMAWNEIRHRARLVKSYGKTPLVEASESRLGQVFLNLVVNAAQAIAEGRAENEIRIVTSTDETGRVIVEIADTGPGMPADVLARLFTPFFTTKPVGVGTGLGLSICRRIVTGLGGSIDVKSEVGKGTVFRVSLPPARPGLSEDERPVALREIAAKRRGRVLVVDDEPMITKVVQRTLAAEHEVVTITSAEEALKRVNAGERFDVILCDLMMPQMTGMDLHAELLRVASDQAKRMVFLTGGAFTARARVFLDETPNQQVEKPFAALHLRMLINDLIR